MNRILIIDDDRSLLELLQNCMCGLYKVDTAWNGQQGLDKLSRTKYDLVLLDVLLPHLHVDARQPEGLHSSWRRTTLLVLAVTLHNIPEGMAVGLSFALAAQHAGEGAALSGALALALGIGIQNFPEGAAISLPLRQEGLSAGRAFLYGSASGVVEPVFGILVVLVAGTIQPLMPWLLSFAAGAMMYVVVEELIPEAHLGEHSNTGTLGVMAGFLLMMVLDVALG